ncbi:MAG: hypothetical protein U0573_14360 [Phycisphaerales bacterium]|nr:hypothetical protein [Planctomycetota bacterium]
MADPRVQTWSSLLAVWTDFARAAGALPKDGPAGLLRRSVPAIIGLQAITQALAHLDEVASDEYCSGQDRAALGIRTLQAELRSIWEGSPLPAGLQELIADSDRALEATRTAGYEFVPEADGFCTKLSPGALGDWVDAHPAVECARMCPPGKRVRCGAPVVFLAGRSGRTLPRTLLEEAAELVSGCLWGRVARFRQLFETADPRGIRQVVVEPGVAAPGTPLLEQIRPSVQAPVVHAGSVGGPMIAPASL